MKKTILFISYEHIEYRRRVLNQIETADKSGFKVKVISISKKEIINQKYEFEYVPIVLPNLLSWGILAYPLFNLILFLKILLKKYDVINFRGIIPIPAILIRQWFNKSILIYDAHEYFRGHLIFKHRPIRKAIWMWFERQIVKQVKHVITVCEPLADLLKEDYPIVKSIEVIRSVPDLDEKLQSKFHRQKTDKLVVFHGYFLPGRALENIIKSIQKINVPLVKLMLIGEGILENKLKRLTNDLCLNKKIEFQPFITNEQLIKFISRAQIGLVIIEPDCTNRKYALPNKFFECIHAGLPVLTSNIPTLKYYVEKYQVGQTVNPNDVEGIARSVEFMLSDENQLKIWQENCRKAALELNWQNESKKLEKIYQRIMML
jgi:glycosyltransferase involved in cell wall biosynthesis